MMSRYKINGIRLNRNLVQVTPKIIDLPDQLPIPFYQTLASNRINMVFMTLNTVEVPSQPARSGVISSKDSTHACFQDDAWEPPRDVCMVSIYPHHYQLGMLGFLFSLIGRAHASFSYLISSNAMLTFVVDKQNSRLFVDMLSTHFDLPDSHAPFDQEENQELTLFLKKKYPETRATYVEQKIKTYGIALEENLVLDTFLLTFDALVQFGQELESMTAVTPRFFHVAAYMDAGEQIHLFLLSQTGVNGPSHERCAVEMLSFQGPHFGDRHSIVTQALGCFSRAFIPVLLVGCTGASISIVVPEGRGIQAKSALMEVFELPA